MTSDINKIEAAVFRRIVHHFRENTEITNISMLKLFNQFVGINALP